MKDGAYVINLDECKSIGNRWIVSYVNESFNSFGAEHVSKEIKNL